MMRNILLVSLSATVFLRFMYSLAAQHDLFWRLWWYDIPMHFLGGVVLGGLGVWFFGTLGQRSGNVNLNMLGISVLSFVVIVGVVWEIFEYSTGNTFNTIGSYPLDTAKDLLMDFLGALAVFLYARGSFYLVEHGS